MRLHHFLIAACMVLLALEVPAVLAQSYGELLAVTMRQVEPCRHARMDEHPHVSSVSREGNNLTASVLGIYDCGFSPEFPRAELSNGAVILSWLWNHPSDAVIPECECAYNLEFRVTGLPDGEVKVTTSNGLPKPKVLYYVCVDGEEKRLTIYEEPGCKPVYAEDH